MSLDITFYKPNSVPDNREEAHWQNITHNLGPMAAEAGIYDCLWHGPANGFKTAGSLIEPLTKGLGEMIKDPARFKAFDASNKWGTYDQFVPWLSELLKACTEYPDCEISVSV